MSQDFPNRQDWLAYRTKFVNTPKVIHVSGYGLAARKIMVGGFEIPAGKTYDVGRNKTKRAKKATYAATITNSGLVKTYMLHRGK